MFSFVAAMGYAAATRGQATAEADALLKDRAGLERAINRSEAELATLPRHRPAGAVQAELRATEVRTGMNCRNPRRRWVRKACAPVLALRAELAAAEDAARIEAHLQQLRTQINGRAIAGSTANPQADVLSWLAGGMVSAEMWERLLTVFAAALIELSAALGLAITARSAMELRAAPEARPIPATQPEPVRPILPETAPAPVPTPEQGWQMWFQQCVAPAQGERVTAKDAYAHYEGWVGGHASGGILPYITFGRRMAEAVEAIGGKVGKSSSRFYADVALTVCGAAVRGNMSGKLD